MLKRHFVLLLALIVTSLVLACSPAATSPTSAPATAAPSGQATSSGPAATTAPVGGATSAPPAASGPITFLSTQFTPVEEAERMRKTILGNFKNGTVEFISGDEGPMLDRVAAEQKAGKGTVGIIGALHGTFVNLEAANELEDLSSLLGRLSDRPLIKEFVTLGKLGKSQQFYIPWMQATYIMVVNKKALQYLPAGADVNAMTYIQLAAWGKAITDATKDKKIGFPAGPTGLMHRLTQGYLYPSYTGALVTTYRSDDAVKMWTDMKNVWQYTNPQSTTYSALQDPLLSEEIWVGVDHVARVVNAFKNKPNDFIAVPAPAGPKGRYYMSVLAGLAIPKNAPNRAGAEALIEYLTRPEVQAVTLRENSFYPVLESALPADLPADVKAEAEGVVKMSKAPDAKVALLPIGLGSKGGDFNKVMQDSLSRILLKGEDIKKVLDDEATILNTVMNDAKAACWSPDPPSSGPCQAK